MTSSSVLVGSYVGRRWRVFAIAALPVLAVAQFAGIAPASAHRLSHHHLERHRSAVASGQDLYNYAPERARGGSEIDSMAASAASGAGIPASLVARVIRRESGGNPRAVSSGNYGLMQIRLGTARAMGYTGSAEGLLDAQTNMTYAVKYLAGAYRAAGGNEDRAVALYARGYHDVAKAQGLSPQGFSPYETAQSGMRRVSYRHVADAGSETSFGFAAGPQFGGQGSFAYSDGAREVRGHRHHRRGV